MPMELHQLRYFVATADAGSMSRAAEHCRVAQPSLSQQIKRLEVSLGARLFDRLGRGVALTDAGRALLPRARRILSDVDDVRAGLEHDVDQGMGHFSVGAIPTMAPYLLPGVLADLRRALPACEITVREDLTDRLIDMVVDQTLDAAIVSTPIEHDAIELEVVGAESMLVVAPASGPLEHAGEISLPDLRELPRVSLHEMHCLGQQISAFCSMRRVGGNVVCRTTQLTTLMELVRMGLGVSIVPEMAVQASTGTQLRCARLKRGGPMREIAIARLLGRSGSRAADTFSALVRDAVTRGTRSTSFQTS